MMPSVGFMVGVVGLGSSNPEFKSQLAVELIPGVVDSACHPSEVGKMSISLLVSCVGEVTCLGLYSLSMNLPWHPYVALWHEGNGILLVM